MNQADILAAVSPAARKHLDPQGPLPPRMMAAKGMVPLAPREMVLVLCGLMLDADEALKTAAVTSLQKLPDKILQPALDAELPPAAWGVLAGALTGRDELLEKVVTNRATPDDALALMAPTASAKLVEILAENQERCLRSEPLVRAVRQNAHLMRSSMDRLVDFLVRSGVIYDDMPEFADSLQRLSPTELAAAAENVTLPMDIAQMLAEPLAPGAVEAALQQAADGLPPEGEGDAAALLGEEGEESTEEAVRQKQIPMLKMINNLNAAQKVALAMKGNKEARGILMRDANRMIAVAAIRNPRLTEQEIVAAAKSRQVNDEVIRIICNSRDMIRSYGVKLALVGNPKTPLPVALRLLPMLRQQDLRSVAKSKSISSGLANQAKKMLATKSQ